MLTDSEFALVAREMKTRTGYALTRELGPSIETRLMTLQRRENFANLGELVAGARADGRFWDLIADALAPHDTRFFRDRALFKLLRTHLLPQMLRSKAPTEKLRILSAGCSTGQEPYSLAIMLDDLRMEAINGADIIACDFSERLLEKARSGLYTQFEVQRGLPIRALIQHFEKTSDLWRISDRLRAQVRFERHNLLADAQRLGRFDIVICCDVLPAMDKAAQRQVLENIASLLSPNGVLATGAEGVIQAAGDAFAVEGVHEGVYTRNASWRKAA